MVGPTRRGGGSGLGEATARELARLGGKVAVLDINLGDRNSFPIADRLVEMSVPFFFASGYGEQAKLPMEHRSRPLVQKPYTLENMARSVAELLGLSPTPES